MNNSKILSFLFVLVVPLVIGIPSLAASKKVLIIYSYDEKLPWTQQCDRGIREALYDNVSIERFFMDTKRISEEEFKRVAQASIEEFERIQPDLVMVSDDNALRLIGHKLASTGIPVVYLGINGNPRNYFEELPQNVTGVIERIPLLSWVRILFSVVPDSQSVLVLMDDSSTAEAIFSSTFKNKKAVKFGDARIYWVKAKDWTSWKRCVLDLQYDILVMPIYHALNDESGVHVSVENVVSWTSANSRVPVFASQDYAVGDEGVVGALSIAGVEHGQYAGRIARNILEGVPVGDLLSGDDQEGELFFNRKQLRRFGLALPETIKRKANVK